MTDNYVPIGAPSTQPWRPHAGRAKIVRIQARADADELLAAALSHRCKHTERILHLGVMFCIQRELRVRDEHPDWPNWLASADYLITATIIISVLLVILPLVVFPALGTLGFSIAAASCAAASILLLAYPFAILDHYRPEV